MVYEVNVGNVGNVYEGESLAEARATYQEYVKLSKKGYGRAASEPVCLFCEAKGGVIEEYQP